MPNIDLRKEETKHKLLEVKKRRIPAKNEKSCQQFLKIK